MVRLELLQDTEQESFSMAGQQFWSLMAGCWEVYSDLSRLKACFYCAGQNLILLCSYLGLFLCFFQVLDFFFSSCEN